MTENLLMETNQVEASNYKVPEKFRDAKTGDINVEALLKSYLELEKKLSTMIKVPSDEDSSEEMTLFRKALGIPDAPDGYTIEPKHKLLASDDEVNQKLFKEGFTPKQAQLVYDLAAERIIPFIEKLTAEYEADRQRQKLLEHFGGEERWSEISRQIAAWGEKNLPQEIYQTLATTYEGVIAISRMMSANEPSINGRENLSKAAISETEIKNMMKDPRYWRDKDSAYIAKVSDGFKKIYS